ncbi:MAG: GNAT family N-acetyltransferase [Candidatus Rifleibacteriota bacterium]
MVIIPKIETERALITVLTPDDAHLINAYYLENKEHLAPFEPERVPEFYCENSWKGRLLKSFSAYKCGVSVCMAALTHDRQKMLAACNFTGIVRGPFNACYLGYSVGRDYEGTGMMFEVASASIKYMFETVKIHRIMANHMPDNHRSARLLQRLGFEREGFARLYLKINGEWRDHVLNSIINPDPDL